MGNDKSGNSYSYTVNPTSEFGEILNKLIGETGAGLGKATWTMRLVLQVYEKRFREISMEIERVTELATRVRVNVDKGEIFKDRATATEIIVQATHALENDMTTRRKMQAQAEK